MKTLHYSLSYNIAISNKACILRVQKDMQKGLSKRDHQTFLDPCQLFLMLLLFSLKENNIQDKSATSHSWLASPVGLFFVMAKGRQSQFRQHIVEMNGRKNGSFKKVAIFGKRWREEDGLEGGSIIPRRKQRGKNSNFFLLLLLLPSS